MKMRVSRCHFASTCDWSSLGGRAVGLVCGNAALNEPITFPIVTTVPALIATICGLKFFKEITGLRNYILLGCAFCVTAVGVALNALSR
nr:unnamed protein product [Spirometra erinaceieuropaei]